MLFLFCFLVVFVFVFYQNFKIHNLWCNAQVWAKPVKIERKELKADITIKNLLIMQENEFSGTISIYPSTMQPLCRPTHVDKLVTSNFQICFPAPYLSLHAKYSHCRTCSGLPYKRFSLITVKLHAMVLSFFKSYPCNDINLASIYRPLYLSTCVGYL